MIDIIRLYSTLMAAPSDRTRLQLALECLASSGRLRLRVTGASMLPAIQPRSYVTIRRATPAEIAPGRVILARTADGVRLHRLIEIRGQGTDALWITRGDNHDHSDPPLRAEQVLGVLTHVEEPRRPSWFFRLARIA